MKISKYSFKSKISRMALLNSLLVGITFSLLIYSCDKADKIDDTKDIVKSGLKNGGTNLVTNPSFESSLTGWESWQGSISQVSLSGAPNGNYVAKVTRSTGTTYTIDDNPATITSTTAGQKHWASVWVRSASSSSLGKAVNLKLREINSSGTLVKETTSPGIVLTNNFQQLFVTVTVSATGNTLDMRVSQSGAVSGDAFYADLFELVEAPTDNAVTNPSFESNLTGWESWQGALSRVALVAPDGGFVVKVTRSTGTSFTVDDNPASISSTIAGENYSASAWVQSASTSSQGKIVTLRLREITSGGSLVQEWISTGVALTNNFQKLTVSGVANSNGNTLDIRISQAGAVSGDAFYADLFVLQGGSGTPPPPQGDPAEKRPFDPNHPIYHPIPVNCPVYQYSSQIVSHIIREHQKISFDVGGETPPIYIGLASDPTWTLTIAGKNFSVHAPNNIAAGTGSDYPLVILDKSSVGHNGHPVEYRMWQATVNLSQHKVTCNGGGVGVYANDGRILDDIATQEGLVKRALGQAEIHGQNTGSGCSYTVGMIRPIDIQRGRIDHAMRVAIGYPHATNFFWPALRTEVWDYAYNENCPMGARIFLDQSVNIDAIADAVDARLSQGLNDPKNKAFARLFLVALQEYGLIALDGTGSRTQPGGNNVYLEGDQTANWENLIGQKNGWGTYNDIARAIMEELPYDKLRVADPSVFNNYGR